MITLEEVNRLFIFDLPSGNVYHRISHGRAIEGELVGWRDVNGYNVTKFRGRTYFVHKLIWFHAHGVYPDEIDHRDGNPRNNSLGNLRLATRTQNLGNANSARGVSGIKGVHLNSSRTKWRAMIQYGGRSHFLGDFDDKSEAAAAYRKAADKFFGEFAYHNRPPVRRM